MLDQKTWDDYNYGRSVYTKSFDLSQVQIISMYNTSDTMWSLSLPHIYLITENLKSYNTTNYDIFITFKYSFTRPVIILIKISNLQELRIRINRFHIRCS